MVYPDISVEEWIKKHPSLRLAVPALCKCGHPIVLRAWLSKDARGLGATGPCGVCGQPQSFSAAILVGEFGDQLKAALASL